MTDVKGSGSHVVESVVKQIHSSGLFPDDKKLLRRIAYVESKDGTDRNTYRPNYYGGIWQVDLLGFQATQDTGSHPGLNAKHAGIKQKFGIDWPAAQWSDLLKPLYSGLAARLVLSNIPAAVPADVRGQAEYWKKYYNTGSGAGTPQKFIDDVAVLEK
ncbi:uncharacterized protein LOC106169384 [Lingula anatina]|uniref:Uncharacterized protein LOC106169384 n=1 Tax=Lingula anatina TaxID=7574 RepID=A0A1S3J200_LINAN|nr:uncharacterized protein LOC106169384 [Lingula anatina]|eukprot:XP_013404288.1 uncharacterized protein LOC106169384 [Lingula anatina]